MLILLALIAGAVIGVAIHIAVPHRELRGATVAPITATVLAGVTWTALTWAGLGEADIWLWLAALAAPVLAWPATVALTRARRAHDAKERSRLGIG